MDSSNFSSLPLASHILITFPLPNEDRGHLIPTFYKQVKGDEANNTGFILLGSTRPFYGQLADKHGYNWQYNNLRPVAPDSRFRSEDEFLKIGGLVLNLAGLWGGSRHPANWIDRIAPTKDVLRGIR